MAIRNFINGAPVLPLAVAISDTDVTLQVSSTAGYPNPPFTIALDRGTSTEEVVLCTATSANTFTVTRGHDNTTAQAHGVGGSIEHATSAADYAEANTHINSSGDVHSQYALRSTWAAKGTLVAASAASTPAGVAVGSNNLVLLADSAQAAGIRWGQIVGASITDGTLTFAKLDTALQRQVVQSVTTSTLPGSPVNGQIVYTTDDHRWVGRNNNAWAPMAFGVGRITYSTSAPTGGADGDVWLRYS